MPAAQLELSCYLQEPLGGRMNDAEKLEVTEFGEENTIKKTGIEYLDKKISFGRFSPVEKGQREIDLFIWQKDGEKIVDPEKQDAVCSRLKVEMLHPLRVIITNRGPDTELLVANPIELSGNGRPRVFYDVKLALKTLGICIFSTEIGKQCTADCYQEVYRFLLDDDCNINMSTMVGRNQIVDKSKTNIDGMVRQELCSKSSAS